MRQVADGIWLLAGYVPDLVNVYLADGVLFDAGTRWARPRILRQIRRRRPQLVALTHCHPDHQGAAAAVCRTLGIPLACHEADVAAMEGREPMLPRNRIMKIGHWLMAGPPRHVDRALHHGDEVAGFRVLHAPGHTPGHIVYFRERDRVAIAGDVLANINFLTGKIGLREPPLFFSADASLNRKSARLLAALRPGVTCFGHGPPLCDPEALKRFVERLPP